MGACDRNSQSAAPGILARGLPHTPSDRAHIRCLWYRHRRGRAQADGAGGGRALGGRAPFEGCAPGSLRSARQGGGAQAITRTGSEGLRPHSARIASTTSCTSSASAKVARWWGSPRAMRTTPSSWRRRVIGRSRSFGIASGSGSNRPSAPRRSSTAPPSHHTPDKTPISCQ